MKQIKIDQNRTSRFGNHAETFYTSPKPSKSVQKKFSGFENSKGFLSPNKPVVSPERKLTMGIRNHYSTIVP
jgi:hypothetical protein